MDYQRASRRTFRLLLGKFPLAAAFGAVLVVGYDVGAFLAGLKYGIDLGLAGYLGGGAGGFVAGALVGTNWEDGLAVGLRASLLGAGLVAIVFAVVSFAMWFAASGTAFFFWSPVLGAIVLTFLAPIHLFTGAVGGFVGAVLRRAVIPDAYNPPAY